MLKNLPEIEDKEMRSETLKTMKSRRYFYVAAFIVLSVALLYLAGQVLNILATPVAIIVWTTIIVFCLKGPVNHLEEMGVNRFIGTCVAYIIMALAIGLIAVLMFSPLFGFGEQLTQLINNIPSLISAVRDWSNDLYVQYSHILQDARINQWMNDALAAAGSWASSLASSSAQGVVTIGSGVGNAFMVVGFSMVVAFWVLMELPAMGREVKRLFGPKYEEDLNMIYLTGTRVMGGYIKGTLIQCVLIGVACGIGFAVIGIPSAAPLGAIAGLLNIIPVVGPWLGGALAAIVGVFVSPLIAVVALAWTIVVQQVVYTFVSPKIMADSVDVHPALVILALMTGSAIGFAMSGLMGSFVGMLASIPAVAAIKSLFVYYFEKASGRVIVAEDGVMFKGTPSGPHPDPVRDATGEFLAVKTDSPEAKHRKS